MAIFREHAEYRYTGEFRPFRAAIAWLALVTMLCLPGCRGCHKVPDAEEEEKQQAEEKAKEKEKKKEKEPFEARMPNAIPTGPSTAGLCKPGHWISQVWPEVKANRGDFQGEMQTELVCDIDHKVPLNNVPYEIVNSRPVALAKEQPKSLESFTWIPPRQDPPRRDADSVNFKLAAGEGGPAVIERSMLLKSMPSYCYYFVVLSQASGRYEYLKKLGSIHLRRVNAADDAGPKYYEVVSMSGSRRPSLPTSALYWTSIAYLLWDDFDPAQCDVDQQRALIDWLHWGGQVIVSGPDALEQLRNSFLRPYLPATVEKSRTFSGQDLAELSYWAGEVGFPPRPVKPWPGAVLKTDPKDRLVHYLPYTGDLLVERQVGRGRIVASAFRLTGPELTGWAGFDCLFNACLLRRPAREFRKDKDQDTEETQFRWAGSTAKSSRLDAAKMTAVRYFARDTGVEFNSYASDIVEAQKAAVGIGYVGNNQTMQGAIGNGENASDSTDDDASIPHNGEAPGLGAWNDFSPVAQAARKSLDDAAGINVPARSFVVWVVVGYLCVLVPANWIVFRLLGRIEWAWIAAPLIAIGCTVLVIHEAQVNIGFARSRNEIAVIEMQPGYSRVHVARYNVLYTSLSTRYEFRLEDSGGQILPFPGAEKFEMPLWQTPGELVCRRGEETQLTGFNVASNTDDFMHSEEMADFGGTLNLLHDSQGGLHVTNGTKYTLRDCRAVRGGKSGYAELAHVGRLEPGASTALTFDDRRRKTAVENGANTPVPSGELRVDAIADVALNRQDLRPGEICLLALVDGNVPGLTVIPEAGQVRQAALLVAHLDAGQLDVPQADYQEEQSPPQGQGSSRRVRGSQSRVASP